MLAQRAVSLSALEGPGRGDSAVFAHMMRPIDEVGNHSYRRRQKLSRSVDWGRERCADFHLTVVRLHPRLAATAHYAGRLKRRVDVVRKFLAGAENERIAHA